MQYRRLGRSDLNVSEICLGTMTWGQQNSESEAHEQLDRAIDAGVNFIDTAEMYPVPARQQTQGHTERYIGSWLAKRRCRDRVVLATKAAGRSADMQWIRGGPRLTESHIRQAVDGSLQRLQTDYIDLYQIHWPERRTNFFGRLGYRHIDEHDSVPPLESLSALKTQVDAGKIRYVGLSNETPWGVMRYLALAERLGLPRITSIQNPYNLLNRTFEIGLAEISHREDVPLLPYSPLAFGTLTGKYADGAEPADARLTLFPRFSRYTTPVGQAATARYVELAGRHGLKPAEMALAYVRGRPFVASTIIGATTMAQLEENLASVELTLPEAVEKEIEAIHTEQPNPCP